MRIYDSFNIEVKDLFSNDLWDLVCEIKGWNPWILNEGLIDENEIVEIKYESLTEEQYFKFINIK